MNRRSVVAGAVVALLACGPAFGQSVPKEMSWTAYDTGSSGFNIAVAIGQQFKNVLGSDVRVLPSGNDTGRLGPVKANRAILSQMGIGMYFAQEGVFEFGGKSWGPQPVRLMMAATACNGITLAVAKDTGVKEVKDIRGKRVGVVVGSPALTQGVL
ncbi:C4-dicarboxylate ABC transporter, partial [cyanobacterium TDX16]